MDIGSGCFQAVNVYFWGTPLMILANFAVAHDHFQLPTALDLKFSLNHGATNSSHICIYIYTLLCIIYAHNPNIYPIYSIKITTKMSTLTGSSNLAILALVPKSLGNNL
jgi:hypothetical protein